MPDATPTPLTAPLDRPLAVVDLETTGGSPGFDRVIEIGVLLIDEGRISQRWQQLVDPGFALPYGIEQLTGIRTADLRGAPAFAAIAEELQALLKDRLFVAHNARFDYGFLKAEFARLGQHFDPDRLCTVRWSRQLYPDVRGHGLDAVCTRFGIDNVARHRALGDAEATWQFLALTCATIAPTLRHSALVSQLKKPSIPPALTPERIAAIPEAPGVYRFFGEDDSLLYIGKSNNLRARVMQHFGADPILSRNQKLHERIREISIERSAGELGALLRENAAIKAESPLFNRRQRQLRELVAVETFTDEHGYLRTRFAVGQITGTTAANGIGYALFRTRSQAREKLFALAREHRLCKKLLGLESGKGACFDVQLKRCSGACTGQEASAIYNLRLQLAMKPLQTRSWPWPGPIVLVETDGERSDWHVIDLWCHLGTVRSEADVADQLANRRIFDLDTYRILQRWLRRSSARIQVLVPGQVVTPI